MIHISDKKKCSGCTACRNICPRNAISMESDAEGFQYPSVNRELCVECGLCEKVCPILNPRKHEEKTGACIVRYCDAEIVKDSTSGGAFTAFASRFLAQGGVVYGAGYDDHMRVVCKQARTVEQLAEMRGSKFVQSELGESFREIRKLLKEGQPVMFTGTPCQVAGLVSFLNGKPDNLFCMDFVCRGVPSPALWQNYVAMMERKYGSKMVSARFKNKTYGYHASTMKVEFENGKTWYGSGRVDPMMKAFVRELASRPSCEACSFKSVSRWSDITMFDCYRFSEVTGRKDDGKGYTSLLLHTEKAGEMLKVLEKELTIYPADLDLLIEKNGIMVTNSAKANPKRERFYALAAQTPIDRVMDAVSPITVPDHIMEKGKGLLHRLGLISILKKIRKRTTISISGNETV